MKKILLIGDVHGLFSEYFDIVLGSNIEQSIQLGDMGIGFSDTRRIYNYRFTHLTKDHTFIRGNHDNPSVCKKHENYLGDYGITEDGIFYLSGALSIDKEFRTPEVSWWKDEELSIDELTSVIELYAKEKPEIVISHTCPTEIIGYTTSFGITFPSRTSRCMDMMMEIHKPKKWIFGHMHTNWEAEIDGTFFKCLNELSTYVLEV